MADCIFCKIINKEIPAETIYEDDTVLAFLDIGPVHPGHTLIVSKEHHKTLLETPVAIACSLTSAAKKIAPALIKATNAQGFNLALNNGAAAGQVIWHTHYHLIPRFDNDGLKLWPHQQYKEGQMKTVGERIRSALK